ncbi:MAG: GAF domain-containing protein, partial [Actinomycetota bacterium]
MGDISGPVKEENSERVEDLERTLAALREDYEVANILLGLSGALAEVRSVRETLDRAVRTIPGLFGADQSLVAQWEPETQSFTISHTFGYDDAGEQELRTRSSSGPDAFPFLRRSIEERTPVFASEEPAAPGAVIAIPLFRWEKDFGALRIEFDQPREFTSRDRDLARGIAHQLGQALSNARRFGLLESLRSFASSISEKVRYGHVVEQVLSGASSLLDADGAWIYTIDSSTDRFVSTAALEGGLSLPERLARVSMKDAPWSQVLKGETVSWDEGSADFYSPVPLLLTVTPLATRSGVFGALMVVNKRPAGLGPDDQEALRVLATQGAQALENSRRFERERSVAHSLQRGLLRTEQPDMKNCDFAAIYRPADGEADIGGDFYDLIDLPNGRLG